jgi:signal recognition particle GTPase
LRAEIPDDDQRLEAEGLVHALQENLVDLVARRQMFEVRCRTLIEQMKLDDARKIVDQMRRLGRQEDFLSTIRQQKERTYSAEKATQKKIDKLFDDTEAVVNRFLSNAQIDKLEQEIDEKAREQPLVPAAGGG